MKARPVVPAISLAAALIVAVIGYALARTVQCLVQSDVDPTMAGWSIHVAYFWRIATVVYAGGLAGFCVFLGARAHPPAAAHALARLIPLAAMLLALQAALFP